MEAGSKIASRQGSTRRRLDERAWRELFRRLDGAGLAGVNYLVRRPT